jgi:cell division protein FtsW
LLGFFAALSFPYQRLAGRLFLQISFCVCVVLLVAVFFMPAQDGAHRWIVIGPIRFQPSELIKLFAVLYVAAKLSRRKQSTEDLREMVRPCLLIVGMLALLVLCEPDLGSTAVLIGVPAVMLFGAGLHRKYIAGGIALGIVGLLLAVLVAPYRLRRILDYIEYVLGWSPPVYQLDQSLIAVGSGGPTGVGLGQSIQKAFYLPAAHTDFIFSIVGEELGLVGTLGLLAAFLVIFARGIRTFANTKDAFGAYLALGLTCLIVGQALIHMAVCLGLLPTTGLTLPLVSYGGTSLVTSMVALGLLINISQGCNLTLPGRFLAVRQSTE